MKHMGQLWLAAEIQDLESKVKNRTSFSPYLVLDVEALIHYQHLAKQFVSARKFIVLVPFVGKIVLRFNFSGITRLFFSFIGSR